MYRRHKKIGKSDLIGIVKGYIPYEDIAISLQTNTPKIVFTENSSLASVETVDTILETIAQDELGHETNGRVSTPARPSP